MYIVFSTCINVWIILLRLVPKGEIKKKLNIKMLVTQVEKQNITMLVE